MDKVVTNNLNNYKYQSNEAINSEPTCDNNSFNLSSGTRYPLPLVTVSLLGGNKYRETIVSGITCLWDNRATDSMIKRRHTNNYERNMRSNKLEYSTAAGMYCMTCDVKIPFCMPVLSSSKIINHCFHVDNYKSNPGIGYYIIICCDLMVHIGLVADFKRQFLQCYGDTLHMKEPSSLLGQSDLTKRDMREVLMQTSEPSSTLEATERMLKILNSTYAKADLKQVADNETHLNYEERTLLLILLEEFEDLLVLI